jgi:hypothetical protein
MEYYKGIKIVSDISSVYTEGLHSFIGRELRVIIGDNHTEDYISIVKYIVDYITENKPVIYENQNIGYYSWLLQFRLNEDNCYDLYEVNSDGSGFNKGCDTAISVVREQGELCWKENFIPLFPNFNQSVVISDGVYEGKDIEGIRYNSPQDESGW